MGGGTATAIIVSIARRRLAIAGRGQAPVSCGWRAGASVLVITAYHGTRRRAAWASAIGASRGRPPTSDGVPGGARATAAVDPEQAAGPATRPGRADTLGGADQSSQEAAMASGGHVIANPLSGEES